ncbi:copper amine oxidase N-terminal domain-containing protein [Brevibacillus thermoruber]|uniref:Copper amine oxidase N-terminal domain-containing protein n=1 Tax=Brevibacillus thermoruber TaxID=33942 RepID=A0A9X3Z3S6_9BACL|nr:copper amine oxidase N-terminal domain-containing protein [Brevibacillus thermoruber]MDA5108905.1 copper amine oxidase N-terminal domain-containing protein [Brevibacillus thermoruber]
MVNKSAKTGLSALLAATVLTGPFAAVPQAAHALTVEDVSADDTDTDEETEYTIEFEIDKELKAGDEIIVKFPAEYKVYKSLKRSDVSLEDDRGGTIDIKSVSVSKTTVYVTVDERVKAGTTLTLTVDKITNPKSKDEYTIKVETSNESSKSHKISIGKSTSSSKTFEVGQSSHEAGAATSLTLGKISLSSSDKLKKGKYIYVDFPAKDMLPKSIDRADVKVNGYKAQNASVTDSDTVRIEVPSGADGDNYIKLEFATSADIQNPSEAGTGYVYKVSYNSRTYQSEKVEVKASKRASFDVALSDKAPGARSSYRMDLDLDAKVSAGTDITVEFPSADMVPPFISDYAVTVNGEQASNVGVSGGKVSFRTPSRFTSSSKLSIVFGLEAFVTNPKTAGTYEMVVTVDKKKYWSKPFDITGSAAPATPVAVDNSTATVGLTKTAAQAVTGLQVGIKALGVPLVRNKDFVEIVLPLEFRVPAYIQPNSVTVNGVAAAYVGVRGQNLLVYPAQDIPVGVPVQVNVLESAGIAAPAAPGTYSIGVYSSEEPGLLFARPVTVVSPNGVSFKANVASFTKQGKTQALAAAPFTVNGHTLMPASFFRDALGMSVTWTKTSARIVSGGTTIQFTVGSKTATVNGKAVTLPVAVQARNNMPVVPLRFVAERTQYKITYYNGNYTVYK